MSEKFESKSAGYSSYEEWEAVGEIGEIVTETALLPADVPFEVLGDIASGVLEGFLDAGSQQGS